MNEKGIFTLILTDRFEELVRNDERVKTLARFIKENKYLTPKEICALLNIESENNDEVKLDLKKPGSGVAFSKIKESTDK